VWNQKCNLKRLDGLTMKVCGFDLKSFHVLGNIINKYRPFAEAAQFAYASLWLSIHHAIWQRLISLVCAAYRHPGKANYYKLICGYNKWICPTDCQHETFKLTIPTSSPPQKKGYFLWLINFTYLKIHQSRTIQNNYHKGICKSIQNSYWANYTDRLLILYIKSCTWRNNTALYYFQPKLFTVPLKAPYVWVAITVIIFTILLLMQTNILAGNNKYL